MKNREEKTKPTKLSEEEADKLRERSNDKISEICNLAALVVILIAFASFILGKADDFFVPVGIMASIALLAFGAVRNASRR